MKDFDKIHRREFEARKDEFEREVTRCAVELKVPDQFREVARECAPTHAEACKFESLDIDRVNDNARAVAYDNNWEKLGCGVGRCTFKWKPQCVVKVARSARRDGKVIGYGSYNGVTGEESNTYEVASYTLANEDVKKFLTPVVAHAPAQALHGYKWIVQPLAQTYEKGLSYDETNRIIAKIEKGLEAVDAHCEDIHSGNVGKLDGHPVLIDYGFSVRCKRIGKQSEKARKVRKLSDFAPEGDKHQGRHGLKRPRGAKVGPKTQRRRILWAEAGALRRKAKQYTDPDIRERLLADARFLEQQAWRLQTKLLREWEPVSGGQYAQMMNLLGKTRKERFLEAVE